jgi:hypothetical protein
MFAAGTLTGRKTVSVPSDRQAQTKASAPLTKTRRSETAQAVAVVENIGTPPGRWGSHWATPSGLLSAGTILTLAAYGTSYVFARRFYAVFGLSPTDAGYTQHDALADASYHLVALVVLALVVAPPAWLVGVLLRRLALRFDTRTRSPVLRRSLVVATVAILCPARDYSAG